MPEDLPDELLSVLDKERQALRDGAFETLDQLVDNKLALFDALAQQGASPKYLKRIKRRLSENGLLLSAALRGVGAAQARIDALQNVREGLSFYDPEGRMAKVKTNRPALEKKA